MLAGCDTASATVVLTMVLGITGTERVQTLGSVCRTQYTLPPGNHTIMIGTGGLGASHLPAAPFLSPRPPDSPPPRPPARFYVPRALAPSVPCCAASRF